MWNPRGEDRFKCWSVTRGLGSSWWPSLDAAVERTEGLRRARLRWDAAMRRDDVATCLLGKAFWICMGLLHGINGRMCQLILNLVRRRSGGTLPLCVV